MANRSFFLQHPVEAWKAIYGFVPAEGLPVAPPEFYSARGLEGAHDEWFETIVAFLDCSHEELADELIAHGLGPAPKRMADITMAYWMTHNSAVPCVTEGPDFIEPPAFEAAVEGTEAGTEYVWCMACMCGATDTAEVIMLVDEFVRDRSCM